MGYSRDDVFDKGDGHCPTCGDRLVRKNGINGQQGAWQEDHSHPKNKGGKDVLRNMNPICAKCNRKKSDSYNSLAEARRDTQADSIGGKLIDGMNRIKKEDFILDKLPDLPDGFAGASRKRFWKK